MNDEKRGFAPEVAASVREAMTEAGLSQSAAAREMGVHPSALSACLGVTYRADPAPVEERALRWLDDLEERRRWNARMPVEPDWQRTPTAVRIWETLSWAKASGDLCVVYGASGAGKTNTARAFARRRSNVWLATMSPASRTTATALDRIARAMGQHPTVLAAARIEQEIADQLVGSVGLLIVDEAQHLSVEALDTIRGLSDRTGIGVALVGGEIVYARLVGGAASRFAQLRSRVGRRIRIKEVTRGDADVLIRAWGVPTPLRADLRRVARGHGGLRTLGKLLRLATIYAGDDLTADAIRKADRELHDLPANAETAPAPKERQRHAA